MIAVVRVSKICVLGVLLAFCCSANADQLSPLTSRTPDGRFGTPCFSWGGSVSFTEFCKVSFYRLIATPEKYHGRLIVITGYLIAVDRHLVLFPSRESYNMGVNGEGIELKGAQLPRDIAVRIEGGVWPVVVVGVFDAKYINNDFLGALVNIQNVAMIARIPKR